MRISTQEMQTKAINALLDQQAKLSRTQLQVATGNRLLSPADDPSAATRILGLTHDAERYEQYQANIKQAESRLSLEEKVMDGVTNQIHRVRDLAVQANSDTLSPDNRAAIAYEVRQILDGMLALANTKDANGEYLFSGYYQGSADPFNQSPPGTFNYLGDQGERLLQIAPTRHVSVGDSGSEVFMNIPLAGGGVQDMFATMYGFVTDLEADTATNAILGDLDNMLDKVLTVRARVGARLNATDVQTALNEDFLVRNKETLSALQDLDYAQAVSRLNLQMTGLEAAQKAFTRIQNLSLFNYL